VEVETTLLLYLQTFLWLQTAAVLAAAPRVVAALAVLVGVAEPAIPLFQGVQV
jgi:hypothetical protein